MANREAKETIGNLANLNGNLIFCDDSDISGQPNPNIVADLRVLCAIQMESYKYGKIDLPRLLQKHGKKELHATEVVNPKRDSEWYGVDCEIRIDVLKHAMRLIQNNVEKIYYHYVSREQYKQLRKEAEKNGSVNANWKTGLKRVFLRTLLNKLKSLKQPIVLVMDQEKDIGEPQYDVSYKTNILEGGAPIMARSLHIQGLQLADFTAWSITRYVRKRDEFNDRINNPFDKISAEFLAAIPERIESL